MVARARVGNPVTSGLNCFAYDLTAGRCPYLWSPIVPVKKGNDLLGV